MIFEFGLLSCTGILVSEIYKTIKNSKSIANKNDNENVINLYKNYPIVYSESDIEGIQIATNYYLQNNELYKDAMYLNSMVIGAPGSWKSTIGIYPNLLNKKLRGTIIINDPKGEFYEKTSLIQRGFGRKVKRISFNEIQDKVNVLREIDNEEDIFEFAKSIMINGLTMNSSLSEDSTTWINLSASLLTGILIFVKNYESKDKNQKTDNIAEALLLIQLMNDENELESILKNNPMAYKYYLSYKTGGAKTPAKSNILLNINSALAIYLTSSIREITSETTFDLNDIRTNEYAIYISSDKIGSKKIAPVIAPIIQLFLNKSIELAGKNINCLDVHFLLDEFGNMGKINGLEQYLTMMRAYKINMYFVLQSFNQLNNSYSKSEISAIMSGIAHVLFLNNNREQSTVSKLIEMSSVTKKEIIEKEVDSDGNLLKIKTKEIDIKTISEGEAGAINPGEGILIVGSQDIMKINFNRWFEEDRYSKYIEMTNKKIINPRKSINKINKQNQVESLILKEYRELNNISQFPNKENSNHTNSNKQDTLKEVAVTKDLNTSTNPKQNIESENKYKIKLSYQKFIEQNFK